MNIEAEIMPIGFKVLEEKDKLIDGVATIECIMEVDFSINIKGTQKALFTERVKTTYFNEMRGTEMDIARDLAIEEYINNLTKIEETNEKPNEETNGK